MSYGWNYGYDRKPFDLNDFKNWLDNQAANDQSGGDQSSGDQSSDSSSWAVVLLIVLGFVIFLLVCGLLACAFFSYRRSARGPTMPCGAKVEFQ